MSVFKAFEAEVLTRLVAPVLGRPLVDSLLGESTLASYTYSGTGYFLTVRHPRLPAERLVCAIAVSLSFPRPAPRTPRPSSCYTSRAILAAGQPRLSSLLRHPLTA